MHDVVSFTVCVRMCVHMFACVHVCVYMVHVCACVCMCVYVCVCVLFFAYYMILLEGHFIVSVLIQMKEFSDESIIIISILYSSVLIQTHYSILSAGIINIRLQSC